MKVSTKSIVAVLALGLALFGCRPDKVDPQGQRQGQQIEGAFDDTHPTLDTICKLQDSIRFRSSGDNSYNVNNCDDGDWFNPQIIPCDTSLPPVPWGSFVMYNGYQYVTNPTPDTIHWLDVDFSLSPGIFCDFNNWLFTTDGSIGIDPNTGTPTTGTDWSSEVLNPLRNQWKIAIRISDLPYPCFDMAVRLSAVRLSFFAQEIPGSRNNLWAISPGWNIPGSAYEASNEFSIHYCPFACLETTQCNTQTNTVCERVFTGVSCNNNTISNLNSKTLTADASGTASPTYHWSNGATTPSITVNPTVNTSYIVTITDGPCNYRITTYNVNVTNLSCQVPDRRADFCPPTLDVRPGQVFNIRNYVRMRDALAPDWNHLRFTYTQVGANAPTNTPDWNLAAFNAGQSVTVTTNDQLSGRGNIARGEYRVFIYRLGETTYDDYMTIRVHPSRTSNLLTAVCTTNACGYIPGVRVCNVPPGNPSGAATVCAGYSELSNYITGVCGSNGGNPGNYLGACGANPCGGN